MSGHATDREPDRAFVVHPDIAKTERRRTAESGLAEGMALARALPGIALAGGEVVRLARPTPATLFGSGKVAELGAGFEAQEIDLVLIDGPVTPVQQRNLETAWKVKILDRTGLILEIFSDRARTREGVLQVEMAALSYQRTRLVRAWTHLERQRGGLGFVGGPGETQIEADRRAIDTQLVRLRRQLAKVEKTRALHRAGRDKVPFPVLALVGYTNAGKSTLFNRLTGAEVMARDMLFATLDPTMRKIVLDGGLEVILSDTVGFISDLPTELVAAFRATLEEVREAEVILHVRDITHPETEVQAGDVAAILASLGISADTPLIEVWNKSDQLDSETRTALGAQAARRDDVVLLSATTGEGLDALIAAASEALGDRRLPETLDVPWDQARARAWLHDQGAVRGEAQSDSGWTLDLNWTARQKAKFLAWTSR